MKRKDKGITLVTLIVTIIILLILAGITISQLTGSGLFENSKLAEEKYKEAQEKENSILDDYVQQISNSRETVTIDKSELQNLINQMVEQKIAGATTNPTGTVISYIAGSTAPNGYLVCDGTVYNISDYPSLAETIKTGLGSYNYYGGDGTTTFAVPDLRGEFLRGTGTNSHTNQGNGASVGTHQDATEDIYLHTYQGKLYVNSDTKTPGNYDTIIGTPKPFRYYDVGEMHTDTTDNLYTSRPTNTSVLYCIKY